MFYKLSVLVPCARDIIAASSCPQYTRSTLRHHRTGDMYQPAGVLFRIIIEHNPAGAVRTTYSNYYVVARVGTLRLTDRKDLQKQVARHHSLRNV